MKAVTSFQESDRDQSKAQKAGIYNKEELDSPDDSMKRATPDLPRSRSRSLTPDIPTKHSKQPSFTLPSLDENSKALSKPSSRRSSLSDSEKEDLGDLPSHDQFRRFSIASKTDSESSRNSPLQSGQSSKAQSPILSSRKESIDNPVEYFQDPFTLLSLDTTTNIGPQKESESVSVSSGPIVSSGSISEEDELAPPVFSDFSKPKSKSTESASVHSEDDIATNGISSGQSKKRTKKKDDSIKTSTLDQDLASTETKTAEATPPSPTKENLMTSPSRQQQTTGEFDGFQDDYLEDSEYKYKTAICRSHLATGYCEYGPACQYAHGVQELRPRDFDVKFKTELCKNYHAMGMCWFGSRCRFIHDEYRLQAGENEFWLVAPSENLVRVEIVDPENTARKKLLQSLVSLPSQCFPKPWEAQLREDGSPQPLQHPQPPQQPPHQPPQQPQQPHQQPHQQPLIPHHIQHLPPHLQPHLMPPHQMPPHFQPLPRPPFPPQFGQQPTLPYSLPFPVQSYPVPTSLPAFSSPLAATTSTPYALAPLTRASSQPLSRTAPAFVPGISSSTTSQKQDTLPDMGRSTTMPEPFRSKDPSEVQPLMSQLALWHLMDPATRQAQYQSTQPQAAPIFIDPKEGSGRRPKSQPIKNAEIVGESDEGAGRKAALSILQSKASSVKAPPAESPSPRASPIMAPRTTNPSTTPPISQLTSPSTFPPRVLSQTTTGASKKPEMPQEPFSVFEKSTEGTSKKSTSSSYQPSFTFPQSYTTLPSPASSRSTSSSSSSPSPSPTSRPTASTSSNGRGQWRRGRVWGRRGAARRETRETPSSRTTVTSAALN